MKKNKRTLTNKAEDTAYKKIEIANEWAKLGKGKLHFFLVHNGNVDEVLAALGVL